jgi:hexosaminidase
MRLPFLLALLPALLTAQPPGPASEVPVIPRPLSAEWHAGESSWRPGRTVPITYSIADDRELRALAVLAEQVAREGLGARTRIGTGTGRPKGGIHLLLNAALSSVPPTGHRIVVDHDGVLVVATSHEGIFHALQSLRQLFTASAPESSGERVRRVAAVTIHDEPRFRYRGLHLDVARHFQPVAFVKRYIDLLARFKLNVFHWHLTDDQGWRIEIKQHPRLTEVGGCRAETMVEKRFDPYVGDGQRHCGFYTQDEIREVVAYARARYVTVVPEIEMPGHAVAALAAYPELACTPGPFTVRTTWGVDENIFCPSEATFTFLQDVLTEVMALFPSTYIHIGGDEAPKDRWKASPLAQEVMRREGLKDEHELQSWFVQRIERFLNANGRRLIGWDEILEGGLAPQATVMSWRGISGGIEAARQGHDVIMTPTSHLYLDFYQGDARFEPLAIGGLLPLERVYSFEPVPDVLTPAEAQHILGAQGNVWTEYLKTPDAVEYQAWPRALALAELTWSARERKDWESFLDRLPTALRTLDALGVNYRLPHVEGLDADRLTLAPLETVRLRSPIPGASIHYTLDGSDPTRASARSAAPFDVPVTPAGVRVTARAFTPEGRASPPRAATFRLTTYRAPEPIPSDALTDGLRYEFFAANVRRTTAIDTLTASRSGVVASIALRGDEAAEQYALRFTGFLRVSEDALYTFELTSDDGSTLAIGGEMVVDNDGLHGAEARTGMVALRAGLHPITVRFFQGGGGAALSLRHRVGDGPWRDLPAARLLHRR